MKMFVFALRFPLKRFREKNDDKNVINTLSQIRDKTTNIAQDKTEFER